MRLDEGKEVYNKRKEKEPLEIHGRLLGLI